MTPENHSPPPTSETSSGAGPRIDTPEAVLERVLEPVVETMGYALVHLDWGGSGKHRKLAVYLDKEGGISLDDCSRMSPILSTALDAAEESDPGLARLLGGAYRLEVSSPGVDRPLSRRSHFERYTGQRARITTLTSLGTDDKQKNFHGRILAVQPDPLEPSNDRAGTVVLRAEDGGEHSISLALIRRANLVYEA